MNDLQVSQSHEVSSFSFSPRSLDEAMKYATLIADSDLAPKDYKGKPGNVLVAIQMGAELGLKPLQSIQNIAVINGRPSIWGDSMLALVKSHPDFEWCKEWQEGSIAYCTIKRRNQPEHTSSFSTDQAKKAGLLGKQGPWSTYPERMLQLRARGFCCRDSFPDALKGIHLAEEAQDLPKESYEVIEKKSKADIANEKFQPVIEKIDFKSEFANCSTLEELKTVFDTHKEKQLSAEDRALLVKYKDERKAELTPKADIENKQTTDEWVKDFDGA